MLNPFSTLSNYKVLLLLLISITSSLTLNSFCSSRCADYIGACFGAASNECYACEQTLFQSNSVDGECLLISQRSILFDELTNTAMNISGYSTSKPSSLVCGQYSFSGVYTAGDYISKTFTNIPLNHYELVVRFGVGFMGDWDSHDQILMEIDGVNYSKSYGGCHQPQPVCLTNGNDCIRIISHSIRHTSTKAHIKITSSISEVDPTYQFWGVKDLLISAKLCDSKCSACFGPSEGECIICVAGYFLWGNLCTKECLNLYFPNKRMCVNECPIGTFENENKECIACEKDCLVCSNVVGCEVWSNKKSGVIWEQNKMFWILLIVVFFLTFFYLFYECFLQKYLKGPADVDKRMITDSNYDSVKDKNSNKSESGTDRKEKDNNGTSEQIKNVDEYFQTKGVVFEQSGLNWAEEIPTVEQIIITNEENNEKRKKKRARQFKDTQSFEMGGVVENMTQYSNGTIKN